jgi:hypothetical protein
MNARAIYKYGLLLVSLLVVHGVNSVITTLSRNDPAPPYSTDNPFAFCGTPHYEYLKGRAKIDSYKHFVFEVSPFYQRADHGSNSCGCTTELGDISGRWNMIALLPFNKPTTMTTDPFPIIYTNKNTDLPCGKKFPQILIDTRNELLSDLQDIVNPDNPSSLPPELKTVEGLLDLQFSTTANDGNFGYYAVGMKYKKEGVRFNTEFYIGEGVGFTMQTGFSSIDQCASFTNRTTVQYAAYGNPFNPMARNPGSAISTVFTSTWNVPILHAVTTDLMARLDAITSSTEIDYSLCAFHDTSIDDLYGEMFWRYPAQINQLESEDNYPKFLFIPFLALGGTYAIAKPRNFSQPLSLPFGNNGHSAARVRGGFSLDFYETIQLNAEVGVTKFKGLTYCNMPMPNNDAQYPIFPFRTSAHVAPGNNWHILLGFNAHNFWYNWSANFDYIYVTHDRDCITLTGTNYAAPDPDSGLTDCRSTINPFKPEVLMCISKWTSQMFNFTLNYAIAPDFSLGGLIQIPVRRKNAYTSSTFMLSLFINI